MNEHCTVFSAILTAEKLLEEELFNVKWDTKHHWMPDGRWDAAGQISDPVMHPILPQNSVTKKIKAQLDSIENKDMISQEKEASVHHSYISAVLFQSNVIPGLTTLLLDIIIIAIQYYPGEAPISHWRT